MELTLDPVLWERIGIVAAAQPDFDPDSPAEPQVHDFACGLIEQAVEQAEDALVDLGDQG